jgi:hypothetical protein
MNIIIPDGWTRARLLQCLDREIRMRETNYPKWCEQGRMREKTAIDEILTMKAVRFVVAQLPEDQPTLAGIR